MRPELHLPGLHLTLTRINFNAIREFPAQNIQGRYGPYHMDHIIWTI